MYLILKERRQRVQGNSHPSEPSDGLVIFFFPLPLLPFLGIYQKGNESLCFRPEAIGYFQVMDLQITNSWEIFRVQPAFGSSLSDT